MRGNESDSGVSGTPTASGFQIPRRGNEPSVRGSVKTSLIAVSNPQGGVMRRAKLTLFR